MIYVLLTYIAIVLTYIVLEKKFKKPEEKEPKVRTKYSKANYSTPLQTYKEYDQFKDKKSKLYVPIKQKGRGEEIKKKEE